MYDILDTLSNFNTKSYCCPVDKNCIRKVEYTCINFTKIWHKFENKHFFTYNIKTVTNSFKKSWCYWELLGYNVSQNNELLHK